MPFKIFSNLFCFVLFWKYFFIQGRFFFSKGLLLLNYFYKSPPCERNMTKYLFEQFSWNIGYYQSGNNCPSKIGENLSVILIGPGFHFYNFFFAFKSVSIKIKNIDFCQRKINLGAFLEGYLLISGN